MLISVLQKPAPAAGAATAKIRAMRVTYGAVDDADHDHYHAWRYASSSNAVSDTGATDLGPIYGLVLDDTDNLTLGDEYWYRIASIDIYGNISVKSTAVSAVWRIVEAGDVGARQIVSAAMGPYAVLPSSLFPRDFTNLIQDAEMVEASNWTIVTGGSGNPTSLANNYFGPSRFMMKASGSTELAISSPVEIPVDAGQSYYFSFWVGPTADLTPISKYIQPYIDISFYETDASGEPTVLISTSREILYYTGFGIQVTRFYDHIATAPANAQTAKISAGATINAGASGGSAFDLYVASPTCRRLLTANDYADRSVIYAKLGVLPPGHIYGLTLSNNVSYPNNRIDIASGECAGSPNNTRISLLSGITKRLDAAWAAGNNNGGLDTGTATDGTYHAHAIYNPTSGAVDVLLSLSATSPTLPSGYTVRRRIGSIIRSGGAILPFVQVGNKFWLKTPLLDTDVGNPGTSAVTRTLTVPTGIPVEAFGHISLYTTEAPQFIGAYLSDLALADVTPSATGPLTAMIQSQSTAGNYRGLGAFSVMANASRQIRSKLSFSSAAVTMRILTEGWIDPRGRD